MLIQRSELVGTRVIEIDRLVERGARGPTGSPCHFVVDPQEVELVLHSPAFDRQRLGRAFVGDGLIFSDGDHWRTRRRILQSSYPGRAPDLQLADVRRALPSLVSRIEATARSGAPIDIVDEVSRFGLHVLYRTAFHQALPDDHDRVQLILDYFDSVGGLIASTIFPGLGLDSKVMAAVRAADSAMTNEIDRLIEVRRGIEDGDTPKDPLGRLVEALGDDHEGIRDEMRSLLLAGAETTSNVVGFLVLLLADHPAVPERLFTVLDRAETEDPPFLDAVVMETLRLYPPVWMLAREAREPTRIGEIAAEADDLVFIVTSLIQRRPDHWADPDRFDPDRFLDDDGDIRRPAHRYAYFPFGGGRHLCLGRHLGLHEVREAARALVERFRFTPESSERGAELGMVLKPDRATRVRATPREGADR
ncbi:MAG: cytochrome P450 [Planctomycetota bacterium]|nr:cytochrome P450 [Planctomycetota bacterium]